MSQLDDYLRFILPTPRERRSQEVEEQMGTGEWGWRWNVARGVADACNAYRDERLRDVKTYEESQALNDLYVTSRKRAALVVWLSGFLSLDHLVNEFPLMSAFDPEFQTADKKGWVPPTRPSTQIPQWWLKWMPVVAPWWHDIPGFPRRVDAFGRSL